MSLDHTSLGAQVSHIKINSQILLADGPQPIAEKTPCSKHFCISLRGNHMCLHSLIFKEKKPTVLV